MTCSLSHGQLWWRLCNLKKSCLPPLAPITATLLLEAFEVDNCLTIWVAGFWNLENILTVLFSWAKTLKSSKRMRYDVSWLDLDGGVGKMAELTNLQSYQSFSKIISSFFFKKWQNSKRYHWIWKETDKLENSKLLFFQGLEKVHFWKKR